MSDNATLAKLFSALGSGKLAIAEELFAEGVNLDEKLNGESALHHVVVRGSLKGFNWLLEKGVMLNQLDADDLTPLIRACIRGETKGNQMALYLIGKGCDVTYRRPEDEMAAIEFAAKHSSPAVIRELVNRGAKLDGEPNGDLFPALLAVRGGKLDNLRLLVELGCDLRRTTQLPWAKGMTCLAVARLEKHTAITKYLEEIGAP